MTWLDELRRERPLEEVLILVSKASNDQEEELMFQLKSWILGMNQRLFTERTFNIRKTIENGLVA
jgi:hypothetical protein